MKNQNRRKFILKSSKIIATIVGTMTFGKYVLFADTSQNSKVQFQRSHYEAQGDNGKKILVTYESEFGSTSEVANFIGKVLSEEGHQVEVKKIEEVVDLSAYEKVVLGSAIQYDKWMSSAKAFVKKNEIALSQIPVAFFFCCLVLSRKTEKAEQKAKGYADKLYLISPKVKPISVGRFAGVLNYSKMPAVGRILARGLFAVMGIKEGDYRDWDAIRLWAEHLEF